MVMKKCNGCNRNEKEYLIYQNLYPNIVCIVAAKNDRTFFIENTKILRSFTIEVNESYIIPDYI